MTSGNWKDWLNNNLKLAAGLLAVTVIAALGYGLFADRAKQRQATAATALYEARKLADGFLPAKKFADAAAQYRAVAEKFSGTQAAYEAALNAADILLEAKDFDQALKLYGRAVEIAPDNFTKTLALYNRGIAEEAAQKPAQAVQSFAEAAKVSKSDFLLPELMMAQARAYESMRDLPKAMDTYRSIQDKFASKPYYASLAAAFLAQLQGKAASVQ